MVTAAVTETASVAPFLTIDLTVEIARIVNICRGPHGFTVAPAGYPPSGPFLPPKLGTRFPFPASLLKPHGSSRSLHGWERKNTQCLQGSSQVHLCSTQGRRCPHFV